MAEMAVQDSVLRDLLGDGTEPVAVFLPFRGGRWFLCRLHASAKPSILSGAGRGPAWHLVLLEPDGVAAVCRGGLRLPPTAAAIGERKRAGGIGRRGGQRMFADMPRLEDGGIASIALCPLRLAPRTPDVVVVEGPAEVLMWLLLAHLNVHGGKRRTNGRPSGDLRGRDRHTSPPADFGSQFGLLWVP